MNIPEIMYGFDDGKLDLTFIELLQRVEKHVYCTRLDVMMLFDRYLYAAVHGAVYNRHYCSLTCPREKFEFVKERLLQHIRKDQSQFMEDLYRQWLEPTGEEE
jgi:hypothetical protein